MQGTEEEEGWICPRPVALDIDYPDISIHNQEALVYTCYMFGVEGAHAAPQSAPNGELRRIHPLKPRL